MLTKDVCGHHLSPCSVLTVLTVFPRLDFSSLWLIYFITSSLPLLIPFTYSLPTPPPNTHLPVCSLRLSVCFCFVCPFVSCSPLPPALSPLPGPASVLVLQLRRQALLSVSAERDGAADTPEDSFWEPGSPKLLGRSHRQEGGRGGLQGELGRKALGKKEIVVWQVPRPSPSLTHAHTQGRPSLAVNGTRNWKRSLHVSTLLRCRSLGEMLIHLGELCTDDLLGGGARFPLSSPRSRPVAALVGW